MSRNALPWRLHSTSAAATVVPSTLVTSAEFVWKRPAEKETQQEVAKLLGWSRSRVGDDAHLERIHPDVWEIIVGTGEPCPAETEQALPTAGVGTPTSNETLLRTILP